MTCALVNAAIWSDVSLLTWPVVNAATFAVVNATAFVRWQLPESICIAIKMLAGHYFEQREAYTDVKLIETPAGVKSLLYPYKDLRP